MYNLEHLEGEVVTFILATGREIICELLSTNDDMSVATVSNPRYVTFSAQTGEANMVPLTVTSNQSTAYLTMSHVLTVLEAGKMVAEEYRAIISQEIIDAEE